MTIPVIDENSTADEKAAAKVFLKDKRKYVKAQFTRSFNKIAANLKRTDWGKNDVDEASFLLVNLAERFDELQAIQEQIVMCDLDDMDEMDELDPFDRDYVSVRLELKQRIKLCGISKSQPRLNCKRSSDRRPQYAEQFINSRQIAQQAPTRTFAIDHWRGATEVQINGRHRVFFKRLGGSRHRLKVIADDLCDCWATSGIFGDRAKDRFLG